MASSSKLPNLPGACEEDLARPAETSDPSLPAEEVQTFIFEVDAARQPTSASARVGTDSTSRLEEPSPREVANREAANREAATGGGTPQQVGLPDGQVGRRPTSRRIDRPKQATPVARRTPGKAPAPDRAGRSDGARAQPQPAPFAGRTLKQKSTPTPQVAEAAKRLPARDASPRHKARGKVPSWLVSLLAHALLLILLSFATLAHMEPPADIGLLASAPVADEIEEFTDVQLDAESLEDLAEELPNEPLDPGMTAVGELSAEDALDEVANQLGPADSGDLADLGTLLGDAGIGQGTLGDEIGSHAGATFFGAEIHGNRIVFLVDNSGGMQRGGLEALCSELQACTQQLTPKQRFYVIFYSDTIYPLFYPEPAQNFVRATPANLALLADWLDSVEVCLGNAIDEGLAATTAIEPDVVYLLTDGRVNTTRDGRKLNMFLAADGRPFTIHTLGMGTGESGDAADQLRQIADANRGTFRAVEIEPTHRQAADAKKRPYHNRRPGPVWGRHVQPPR